MKLKVFVCLLCCLLLVGCVPEAPREESVAPLPEVSADGVNLFVIDAGHGFVDSGCVTEYMVGTEAEVTLDMANRLKSELEALGAQVLLTHDGVSFPTATEIVDLCVQNEVEFRRDLIADDNNFTAYERGIYYLALSKERQIDMFVSIHVNSFSADETVDRYELYYCKENPFASKLKELCTSFGDKLDNTTKTVAATYEDAFIVTKYGDYPSLLVETGFASNKQAAEKLNDEQWRQSFCKALAEEMMAHFGE